MRPGNEVLNELLSHLDITVHGLSTKINLKRSQNLYDILDGKVKRISHSLSGKIISAYPDINENWLLTGEGNMLNQFVYIDPRLEEKVQITVTRKDLETLQLSLNVLSKAFLHAQKLEIDNDQDPGGVLSGKKSPHARRNPSLAQTKKKQ